MSLRVTPKRPRRTREWLRGTVLASAAEGFSEQLERHGYRPEVISIYLGGVAHFSHWLTRTRRRVEDIDEALIKGFLDRHVAACHCARGCTRRRLELRLALALLLQWLRQEQIVSAEVCAVGGLEAELAEFEHYLIGVCGLAAATRSLLLRHVRCFLSACFGRHPINFARLTTHDVRRFIEQHGARWRPISLRSVGVALRSYFRFKALNGALVEPLAAAIPRVPRWRLTSLPKTLTEAEIERFLGAFDRTRPKGLRDYAMARCLTDLGLRGTEVTRLQLEDIDWDEGTIAIHGKGRRVDRLPLPKALGLALAQYLRRARPPGQSRTLFVRWRAPRGQLTTNAIDFALRATARRCGLGRRFTGTRLFRHTVAARLLQRGASLKAIADVLRHRSFDTTTIYAKVDLVALKRVALSWPGSRP